MSRWPWRHACPDDRRREPGVRRRRRAADEPLQKAYPLSGSGEADVCGAFTVPSGQRLIVQHVAGAMIVLAGTSMAGSVSGPLRADFLDSGLMVVPLAFGRELLVPSVQDRLTVAQAALLSVRGNLQLQVCVQTLSFDAPPFGFFGDLTVTGILTKK